MRNKFPSLGKGNCKGGPPLQTINKSLPEALARQTWLHYYNDYLREHGIITEDEWRKMRHLIDRS